MDWRLAMASLQLQLDGLRQAGWRYDSPSLMRQPPGGINPSQQSGASNPGRNYWPAPPGFPPPSGLLPFLPPSPSQISGAAATAAAAVGASSGAFHSSKNNSVPGSMQSALTATALGVVPPLGVGPTSGPGGSLISWRDSTSTDHLHSHHQSPVIPPLPVFNKKPGRWCAAHVRIAWEIHLRRLQQHGTPAGPAADRMLSTSSTDKSQSHRHSTSAGGNNSNNAGGIRSSKTNEQTSRTTATKSPGSDISGIEMNNSANILQTLGGGVGLPPFGCSPLASLNADRSFAAQLEAIYKFGMNSQLLHGSPYSSLPGSAFLGLAAATATAAVSKSLSPPGMPLFPPPVPPTPAGLINSAASELSRLGDRAAAAAAAAAVALASSSSSTPWPPGGSANNEERNVTGGWNGTLQDKKMDSNRLRDGVGKTSRSHSRAASPNPPLGTIPHRPQSPALRPDSTVISSEEAHPTATCCSPSVNSSRCRRAEEETPQHDRIQERQSSSESVEIDQPRRPSLWNPFLADKSSSNEILAPQTDIISEVQLQADSDVTTRVLLGKHSRSDGESVDRFTELARKKKKVSLSGQIEFPVSGNSSVVEAGSRSSTSSQQSPSSSTIEAGPQPSPNSNCVSCVDAVGQHVAKESSTSCRRACTPDSSCCDQPASPTSDVIKQTPCTLKDVLNSSTSITETRQVEVMNLSSQ